MYLLKEQNKFVLIIHFIFGNQFFSKSNIENCAYDWILMQTPALWNDCFTEQQ